MLGLLGLGGGIEQAAGQVGGAVLPQADAGQAAACPASSKLSGNQPAMASTSATTTERISGPSSLNSVPLGSSSRTAGDLARQIRGEGWPLGLQERLGQGGGKEPRLGAGFAGPLADHGAPDAYVVGDGLGALQGQLHRHSLGPVGAPARETRLSGDD